MVAPSRPDMHFSGLLGNEFWLPKRLTYIGNQAMPETYNRPAGPEATAISLPAYLPPDLSLTLPTGDTIRHLLLGQPGAIHQTIHLLHNRNYAETSQWSPLIEIRDQLILTPDQGSMMSILIKRL